MNAPIDSKPNQRIYVRFPNTLLPSLLPLGWFTETSEPLRLSGPEEDLHLAFVVLPVGADMADLAVTAWKAVSPAFALPRVQEVQAPPSGGWAGTYQAVYRGAPGNEARAMAFVRTLGNRAYITLVEGTTAALGRRMAQVAEIMKGWKPVGLQAPSLAGRKARPFGAEEKRSLDLFVSDAMAKLGIPGIAIAVVQSGETVYAEGFGTRRIGSDAAVTPRTRFMIGSTTKALTTLMMAKLVDEGLFAWETPVQSVLPSFALADADLTDKVQMRHTVSASTGMPRRDVDIMFRFRDVLPEDRVSEMRKMMPTTALGEIFQYSNHLVAAGGYAAAHAFEPALGLAEAYEKAMEESVLRPLVMNDTTVTSRDGENAAPHGRRMDGGVEAIDPQMERLVEAIAPAGSIWSTVLDLAEYLKCELNSGRSTAGEQLVSSANLLVRRQPGITIDGESSYGLGLIISSHQGLTIVSHGGNTLGFTSDMFFLPDYGIGVAVLTNLRLANAFSSAIRQKLLEVLFEADNTSHAMIEAALASLEKNAEQLSRTVQTNAASSCWMKSHAGDYYSDELGIARIIGEPSGTYRIEFDSWSSALGTGHVNELVLISSPWGGGLRLHIDEQAKTLLLDGGQTKYVFARR
jgi:CubicO group peptidase (beta-lactamase class C family)